MVCCIINLRAQRARQGRSIAGQGRGSPAGESTPLTGEFTPLSGKFPPLSGELTGVRSIAGPGRGSPAGWPLGSSLGTPLCRRRAGTRASAAAAARRSRTPGRGSGSGCQTPARSAGPGRPPCAPRTAPPPPEGLHPDGDPQRILPTLASLLLGCERGRSRPRWVAADASQGRTWARAAASSSRGFQRARRLARYPGEEAEGG
eukprot:499067-Prorocentrum_minimum.AAC.4